MTPEAALRQLLAGTGYTFRLDGNGAVILEQPLPGRSQATTLEPVMVQGAAPLDRHAGAADRSNSIAITAADLDRRNPTTLKGVFAGEATVSVGGAQPLSQKVYVQGVEETNLAVSIDGARQNNKVFHHSGTNLIDPALLKRARVDPGVAPADAGPGALGGAIAYETVDVADVLAPGAPSAVSSPAPTTATATPSPRRARSSRAPTGSRSWASGSSPTAATTRTATATRWSAPAPT